MEMMQWTALVVFLVAIGLIIWGKVDRTIVGIIGVGFMVVLGVLGEREAFLAVDWNVIAILFSIWIIATYFGKSGVPQFLATVFLRASGGNVGLFLTVIGVLAGFISMFVDNVVVILMFAPVILHLTKRMNLASFPFIIWVGLSANFMGTALLIGDLPPQMLHSVTGVEFPEFIWQMGRPSSFPILTVTFLVTAFIFYRFKFRKMYTRETLDQAALREISHAAPMEHIKNKNFALIAVTLFVVTILGMAFRQVIGLFLGFIALGGMAILVLIMEVFQKKLESPSFEEVLGELDWRALLFYAALFALVGGLDHAGIIEMVARAMAPFFQSSLAAGTTALYWVTAPIVGVVEHDAYLLVFYHLIKDMAAAANLNPWPMYWAVAWAGTLGSNLTIAGAPALYVAQNICEREDSCKISLREFFSYSVPFVLISLVITFIFLMVIWVIPFM